MQNFKSVWAAAVDLLQSSINETAMNLWIKTITPLKYESDYAVLKVESDFQRDVIMTRYKSLIVKSLDDVVGFDMNIKVITDESSTEDTVKNDPVSSVTEKAVAATEDKSSEYTFSNFIVAESNKHAFAACKAVANHPAGAYNPLFIYGNTGLGKTHLLFAIKNEINKLHPELKTLYVKSEHFINELVALTSQGKALSDNANSPKNMIEFKEKYRGVDVLLVDDVQFIAGKDATQNEFFHTFDALYQANKQIILVSDRPPKDMLLLDERLKSRFEQGLTTDIYMPEYELKVAFIRQKALVYNIKMTEEVVDFIAQRIKNNIRQLEGVMKKLMAFQDISDMPPNIAIAQSAIKDITHENMPVSVVVDKVIIEVSTAYDVSVESMKGKGRKKNVVMARQIAMYILKTITDMSLDEIGNQFGNKDHSTVSYTIDKMEKMLETNTTLNNEINDIIKKIKSY